MEYARYTQANIELQERLINEYRVNIFFLKMPHYFVSLGQITNKYVKCDAPHKKSKICFRHLLRPTREESKEIRKLRRKINTGTCRNTCQILSLIKKHFSDLLITGDFL